MVKKKTENVKDLAAALDEHRSKTTYRLNKDIIAKIKWHMWERYPAEMGLFLEDPKDPEKVRKMVGLCSSSDNNQSETNKQSRGTKR